MSAYAKMTPAERGAEYARLQAEFEALKGRGLALNMARGKPGKQQLDMVSDLFGLMQRPEDYVSDGIDVRNYGELRGLPAAQRLFADILGCKPEQVFVGGSASLQLMYDTIAKAYTHGLLHSPRPWCKEETVKWLCPAPGYDRHFKVTESFGFELITIPMTDEGPDMDAVEAAVKDPAVKGIWCVPKYSNPDGIIYSGETIRRIASLKPAAPDFLVMWDNAYCIHEFEGEYVEFPDILSICAQAGNPDMVFEFASTSKVTFPGAGISCFACSEDNMAHMEKLLTAQVISFDKVNQQRHVLYLRDKAHTLELMKRHAAIMGPKFRCVVDTLDREIAPLEIASWKRPKGGYFVSLNAMPGTAKRTLALCKEAGITMTGAGATFPYGKDPQDSNIRIAPSLPPVEELEQAMAVFCVCLRMAALEAGRMRYYGSVYRPPSEARSLIVQVTYGCSHNTCAFCSMYKEKRFALRPLEEVLEDFRLARQVYRHVDKVFLADGDALVRKASELYTILDTVRELFPECERVTSYASPASIRIRTEEELRTLRSKGLTMVYMGLESGCDAVLEKMRKGHPASEIVEMGQKVRQCGIALSVTAITGLGGPELLERHAVETAAAFNAMDPEYIGMLTLMVEPETPLYDWVHDGSFRLLDQRQVLEETRLLVEHLDSPGSVFRMNHASNYLALRGTLNQDREAMLAEIDRAEHDLSRLRPESWRGL